MLPDIIGYNYDETTSILNNNKVKFSENLWLNEKKEDLQLTFLA